LKEHTKIIKIIIKIKFLNFRYKSLWRMAELVLRKDAGQHAALMLEAVATLAVHREGVQVQTREGNIVTLNRWGLNNIHLGKGEYF